MIVLKAGTKRSGDEHTGFRYTGVLRHRGRIVIECGHTHHNRDISTRVNGEAASVCARMILRGAQNPATAEHTASNFRTAWMNLTRGTGFQVPKSVIEGAQQRSQKNAEDYLEKVAEIRQAIAGEVAR